MYLIFLVNPFPAKLCCVNRYSCVKTLQYQSFQIQCLHKRDLEKKKKINLRSQKYGRLFCQKKNHKRLEDNLIY